MQADAADPEQEISKSLNLTPYSHVTPQWTERRRPVLFAPAALAKALSQKLVNMVGAMDFSVCKPGQSVVGICILLRWIHNVFTRYNH